MNVDPNIMSPAPVDDVVLNHCVRPVHDQRSDRTKGRPFSGGGTMNTYVRFTSPFPRCYAKGFPLKVCMAAVGARYVQPRPAFASVREGRGPSGGARALMCSWCVKMCQHSQ